MSATSEIVSALKAAGVAVTVAGPQFVQGCIATIGGHSRALRLYAWLVSDNGEATGEARPADERRIQASRTQLIDASDDPETVVLGWCDNFAPVPLIVAFNPYGVARRVNGNIGSKVAAGAAKARTSDSQQFKQALLDEASAHGMAIGRNQHGERVVAMRPERFLDYLSQYKPIYHPSSEAVGALPEGGPSMGDRVAEVELEEAVQAEAVGADLPPAFDPAMIEDGRERVAREIAVRRGQAGFRRQLLDAYGCCAMSGCTVVSALEAAHIVPYQGPGTNHPSNGLLLRADLHTLFDLGLLSVDQEALNILVASDLDGTEYEALRGQPLRVDNGNVSPSRKALQVHRAFAGL